MAEKTPEEIEQEAKEKLEAEKKSKKVTFDEAQTKFVNELFERAWAESAARKEKELNEKLAAEKAERERLTAEKTDLEKKLQEATAAKPKEEPKEEKPEVKLEDHPLFKQLQARLDEVNTIFTGVKQERDELKARDERNRIERRKVRKKDQFLAALNQAKIDFYDPLEAYELAAKDGLEYDEDNDRVFVKNSATGQPKLNSDGEPMTAVDFVKEFATRKKYLVKAQDAGGLGSHSTEKLTNEQPPAKDWSKATPEELEAERQRIMSLRRG